MGVSNTAGTVAGIIGVPATGLVSRLPGAMPPRDGLPTFLTPAVLSVLSALHFIIFATGEQLFD